MAVLVRVAAELVHRLGGIVHFVTLAQGALLAVEHHAHCPQEDLEVLAAEPAFS